MLDHDLMFVRVDDIHQIDLLKILHVVFHNPNHKYLDEALKKIEKNLKEINKK